jgi:hypothetical protein
MRSKKIRLPGVGKVKEIRNPNIEIRNLPARLKAGKNSNDKNEENETREPRERKSPGREFIKAEFLE